MLRLRLIILLSKICICLLSVQGIIIEGPSNVTYIPGRTPLPIILNCSITGFPSWMVNGTLRLVGDLRAGIPEGHNISGSNIVINVPMNDTEYICVSSSLDTPDVSSPPAFLYIAGRPAMVGNILIDVTTVNIDNNNVSFTLNWDEPFDNFDPIVNYTITINCNDASCPVMFTVTTTSANVSFITDLSMMTPLSVTAANTVGTSDPTMIIITVPDGIGMVNLICGAVDLINQCTVTWNALVNDPSAVAAPISYTTNYSGENITNGSIPDINVPMATIDLPAVDSDVNVIVTAMNVFGSGPSSNIVHNEIMSPSVIEATTTLVTPNENRTLHFITVTCTINPDSTADQCEVIATANGQETRTGIATINNGMATVTVDGLICEVEYTITAGGTLNGQLVGPRSSHGTVTAGPCLVIMTTTTTISIISIVTSSVTSSTTSTTPSQLPPDTVSDDDNTGAVIGGVVGGIFAVILIIVIITIIILVWYYMKKRDKSRPMYDSVQDPAVSDKVKMETNPAYQEMPSDHNRKGPDPAYQELSSHSGRANVSKPAGDVNYYEDIISDQNIKMTENPSYAVP